MVVAKFATTTIHGAIEGKTQTHDKDFFNLEMVTSVGYRVKSKRGVQFRKWANKVLKQYLLKGYVVNQRLEQLERRVAATEEKIDFFVHKALPPIEGIFYDGQIFDAYVQIANLIKQAKHSIVLVDNYIDETTLTMLSKRDVNVSATIYTSQQADVTGGRFTSLWKCDFYC